MTLQRNADKLNTLNLAVKDDSRRKTIAPPAPPRPKLPLAASLTVARVVTTSASERLAAHPITRTVEDSGAQAGPSANGQAVAKRVRGHAEVQEEGEEDGEEEEEEGVSSALICSLKLTSCPCRALPRSALQDVQGDRHHVQQQGLQEPLSREVYLVRVLRGVEGGRTRGGATLPGTHQEALSLEGMPASTSRVEEGSEEE